MVLMLLTLFRRRKFLVVAQFVTRASGGLLSSSSARVTRALQKLTASVRIKRYTQFLPVYRSLKVIGFSEQGVFHE
jgi:hypothetical protein